MQVIDNTSHTIFIAEVIAARCGEAAGPLLYFDGGYGGFMAAASPDADRC
jgi:flavin reductase (DIM6/NTAB) family NADH-FMN oxidoreductase RutF